MKSMNKYYSQHGQDYWLEREDSISTNSGYFVDVGASHRKNGYMSNTLFFEKHYKWKGILIEPNEKISKPLESREAMLVQCAVSNKQGFIKFKKGDAGVNSKVSDGGESIQCQTITSILEENKAPHIIDFLSMDIEGHEPQALEGINFNRYKFKNVIIEENSNAKSIVGTLQKRGYTFVDNYRGDLYFTLFQPTNKPSSFMNEWNKLTNRARCTSYD
tara:strand:- start:8359 stop:9009 length:651 start_codon:yes stop_codon:yes gene_type:complete